MPEVGDQYPITLETQLFQYGSLSIINEFFGAFNPQKYGCTYRDKENPIEDHNQTGVLDPDSGEMSSEELSLLSLRSIDIDQDPQTLSLAMPIDSSLMSPKECSSTSPTSPEITTPCISPKSPQSKRKAFLQRNRMSASKARAKKRAFIADLEAQENALEVKRINLMREVTELQCELNALEQLRAVHVANGCLGLEEQYYPSNVSVGLDLT